MSTRLCTVSLFPHTSPFTVLFMLTQQQEHRERGQRPNAPFGSFESWAELQASLNHYPGRMGETTPEAG